MTTITPYLPTTSYLCRLYDGTDSTRPPLTSLTRTTLTDNHLLSIPINGGARTLRHNLSEQQLHALSISMHANWPSTHAKTIATLYHRYPYFDHYFPAMLQTYSNARQDMPLLSFTNRILNAVTPMMSRENLASFYRLQKENPTLYTQLRHQYSPLAPPDLSIIHAIFNLGPLLPFAILPSPAPQ